MNYKVFAVCDICKKEIKLEHSTKEKMRNQLYDLGWKCGVKKHTCKECWKKVGKVIEKKCQKCGYVIETSLSKSKCPKCNENALGSILWGGKVD